MDDDPRRDDQRSKWKPIGFIPDPDAAPAPSPAPLVSADPWLGRTFDDRFEIVEAIGQGGMATVYRARESGIISREVAIKLLSRESSQDQTLVARFHREAQLITDIHHPHVVNVFHVGRAEGQLYIVMELLRGQTLQAMLKTHHSLHWSRLAPMMLNICAALQAAHEHKIIHRDIKPSNCLRVDAAGNPDFIKVLDFGIAKVKPLPNTHDEGTQQGTFLGTPHYAAPELIDPHGGPIDGRVDMYALGVVMYQCLTGSLPFIGTRGLEALHHTVHSRPETPRERAPHGDIPAAVDALVMRTMARHPEERFTDMAALADAIRDAAHGRGRGRREAMVTGVIDDAPQRPPPPKAVPDSDSTPSSQPQLPRPEATTRGGSPRPSLSHSAGVRPVVATLGVIALGVLLLAALLAYEAWTPDPAEKSKPPPPSPHTPVVTPPTDDGATTSDTAATTDSPSTTDSPATTDSTTASTTDDPPAPAEERQQRIISELKRLPLPLYALRCGISIVDPWKLQLRLRVAANGTVEDAYTPTRSLALPLRKCLLDKIKLQHFTRGDAPITVLFPLGGGT